jgi:hypothetical protein
MSDDELGTGPAAEPPAYGPPAYGPPAFGPTTYDPTTYDPTTWRAATDILASEPEEPAKRAPWGLVGAAGVLVLALVGGVTYAVGALSGGGSQPADALPSGAFAAVTLDLDPSAGQKLDGFRFLRKFPALRDKVPTNGDLREVMFDAVADDAGWSKVDFDSEVAPWLGKRIGVAIYPPAGNSDGLPQPTVAVALQVSDQDAAGTGLDRLAAASARTGTPRPGWAFSGDYAVLAETQASADRMVREAGSASLASDPHFATDVAAAEDGILLAWADMGAAGRALGAESLLDGSMSGVLGGVSGASGRSTLVARFDGPDVFEVVGRATGATTAGWSSHPVTGLAELPASSVLAFGLADGKALVPKAYDSMRESFGKQGQFLDDAVAGLEHDYGIRVPDDVAVLLGDNLVAALDGTRSDSVQVGARVSTDVPRAQAVLDKVEAALRDQGGELPVVRREAGGDLVIASTDRQAGRLAASGTLGQVPAFQRALPDLGDADVAVWVDPAALVDSLFGGEGSGSQDPNLEPVDGIGVTVSSAKGAEGTATYRFRLVAH